MVRHTSSVLWIGVILRPPDPRRLKAALPPIADLRPCCRRSRHHLFPAIGANDRRVTTQASGGAPKMIAAARADHLDLSFFLRRLLGHRFSGIPGTEGETHAALVQSAADDMQHTSKRATAKFKVPLCTCLPVTVDPADGDPPLTFRLRDLEFIKLLRPAAVYRHLICRKPSHAELSSLSLASRSCDSREC
jgi:hypothetical protein